MHILIKLKILDIEIEIPKNLNFTEELNKVIKNEWLCFQVDTNNKKNILQLFEFIYNQIVLLYKNNNTYNNG